MLLFSGKSSCTRVGKGSVIILCKITYVIIAIKDPSSSKNGCGTWVRWKCWKLSSQPKKICWYLSGSTKKFILCQRKICEWCDPQKKDHSSLNLLSIYSHPSAVTLLLLRSRGNPPFTKFSAPPTEKSLLRQRGD